MPTPQYLTTEQYADLFHKHPQHVRYMCKAGEIDAIKIGNTWRIPYTEPADIQAEKRVQDAVDQIVEPCIAVVDAAIAALSEIRSGLSEVMTTTDE